jgi:hypothetical protein
VRSSVIRGAIELAQKRKGKGEQKTRDLVLLFCYLNWGLNSLGKKVEVRVKVKVKVKGKVKVKVKVNG